MDQSSISPCVSSSLFSLPPSPPPSPPSSPFSPPPPGVFAGPQARWLRPTSFIVCQQISGDEEGGLVRKLFGPQPLPSFFFFLFIHFFSHSLSLFSVFAPSFPLPWCSGGSRSSGSINKYCVNVLVAGASKVIKEIYLISVARLFGPTPPRLVCTCVCPYCVPIYSVCVYIA